LLRPDPIVWTLEVIVALFGIAGWLITRRVQEADCDPATAMSSAAGVVPASPAA
jgi:hypothetical protein